MSKPNPPRVILGPFTTKPHLPKDNVISWGFITIREDFQVQHATLSFNLKTRKFSATSDGYNKFFISSAYVSPTDPTFRRPARLHGTQKYHAHDEDLTSQNGAMFLGDKIPEPIPGRLVDLLRKLLRREDIAMVTRLAIEAQR